MRLLVLCVEHRWVRRETFVNLQAADQGIWLRPDISPPEHESRAVRPANDLAFTCERTKKNSDRLMMPGAFVGCNCLLGGAKTILNATLHSEMESPLNATKGRLARSRALKA
jgi:hypothetical protein